MSEKNTIQVPAKVPRSLIDDITYYVLGTYDVRFPVSRQVEIILSDFRNEHRDKINDFRNDPDIQKKYKDYKKKYDFLRK